MGFSTYEYYYRGIYSNGSHVNLGLVRYLTRIRRISRITFSSGFTRHRLRAKAQYMVNGGAFHGFPKTKQV